MLGLVGLRTCTATVGDETAIAAIYNEGIADRISVLDTEPRSAEKIAKWFTGRRLVMVAETKATGPVAFAVSFPYGDRACYSGVGDFSVYLRRIIAGGDGRSVWPG
jgi:phosphinothricin acetyltransferase